MKKYILLLVCLLTSLGSWAQYSGSGSGTSSDPYLIFNPTQLAQMANFLNQDGVVFELKNNIDLSEFIADNYPGQGWAPIGASGSPFKGTLKGNGKTISGLSINRSSTSYVGLFGNLEGATISELTIEAGDIVGGSYTGLLAGRAENCTLSNIAASCTKVQGSSYVGGLVGTFSGNVSSCSISVSSNTGVKGSSYVGGFAGYANITSTTVTGTPLIANNSQFSSPYTETTEGSLNNLLDGDLTTFWHSKWTGGNVASGTHYLQVTLTEPISGVVHLKMGRRSVQYDQITKMTVQYSANNSTYTALSGDITFPSNESGYVEADFTLPSSAKYLRFYEKETTNNLHGYWHCSDFQLYSGVVTGTNGNTSGNTSSSIIVNSNVSGASSTGGIVGKGSVSLTNCKHNGNVSGATKVGGICGETVNASTFTSCQSKGTIRGTSDYVGGVLGFGDFTSITSCSHFGNVTGVNNVGGIYGGITAIGDYPKYGTSSGSCNTANTSSFVAGTVVTRTINKCTAIGNITGSNQIGGLVGTHLVGRSFRYKSYDLSYDSGLVGKSNRLYRNGQQIYYNSSAYDTYFTPTDYVDYTQLSLADCYYSGDVTGKQKVGGLVGEKIAGEITRCYSYANVVGETSVGGIVGDISGGTTGSVASTNSTLQANVAINITVNASQGIAGRIYGSKSNSYVTIGALGSAEGNISINKTSVVKSGVVQSITDDLQNGTSIGNSMLQLKATYVAKGWNFDSDWTIQETESYPYMRYQTAPPTVAGKLESGATSVTAKSVDGGTVYIYYNNENDPLSTNCTAGNNCSFTTSALQSGTEVRLYAEKEGMTPSYFTTATVEFPGSGTEADPYRIYTAADLQGVNKAGYYKVMNDIDLTSWITANSPSKGWVSIGRSGTEATYIDGDGHKIEGLWINTTEDYTGLFSNFNNGMIKNLTVEVASGKKVKGGNYTGILVGRNANGTIQNVVVKGDVEGTVNVGGVIGYSDTNTLNTVSFNGKVTSSTANAYLGGLAGYANNNTVSSCRLESTVNGTGNTTCAGGAFGYATGSITKTIVNAAVTATGTTSRTGGLLGNGQASISQSVTTGNVNTTGSESYVGGLVGYAAGSITDCYTTATVTGTQYAAGLVGYTKSSVNRCYATGNVSGILNGGGIVAQLDGTSANVQNSVAASNQLTFTDQSSWASRVIGGYKNGAADPDNSNYALKTMQVTLNGVPTEKYDDLVEGIGKEQSALYTSAFYEGLGWNMTSVWSIDEGNGYPYFEWSIEKTPVTGITLSPTSATLLEGATQALTATVAPTDATNKKINWTSSANGVATVSAVGLVTAVAEGEATITATAADGSGVKATCTVTVVKDNTEAINALRALVENARNRYDNSTEGDNLGQYAAGSRAALLAVINAVDEAIADMMTLEDVNACTSQINAAVAEFENHKVSLGEDTDITTLDNVIYIEPMEVSCGQTAEVSVKMKNSISATGFQFNLYLPDGVSVVKDEDDFCDVTLSTARTTTAKTNTFDASIVSDGSLMVLAASTKNFVFSGNDGEVARINLDIAENMEEGEYPLIFRNIEITDASGTPYRVAYLKTTLTVSSYKIGDVNADGSISVADFSAIASHIMENTPTGFVEQAADVNQDGFVTVSDLSSLVPIIIAESTGGASHSPRQNVRSRIKTDISGKDNIIYAGDVTVAPGEDFNVSFNMKNLETAMTGFQYNVTLPEGITVCKDGDGFLEASLSTARTTTAKTNTFDASIVSDGTLMVLAASTKNFTFSGTDGEVVTVKMHADENLAAGTYGLSIDRIELTDDKGTPFRPGEAIVSAITVKAPQALTEVDFDFTDPASLGITPAAEVDDAVEITTPITKGAVTATVDGGVEVTIDDDAYILEIDRGGVLTLSTTAPGKIVKVEFGDDADAYIDKLSATTGELDGFVWTGSEEEVVFEVADTRNAVADITTIKVWLEGGEAPAEDLTFTDGEVYTATAAATYGKVTYTRTFSNTNWQALYVPFSMDYDEWSEKYDIAEIHNFIEYDDDDNGTFDRTYLVVLKKTSGSTEANYPYLIRAKETDTKTLTLVNKKLEAAESTSTDCSSVKNRYTFTGTYTPVTDMYANGYYALSGGALNKANAAGVTLNPQRWYMEVTSRTSGSSTKAQSIRILVDGEDDVEGICEFGNSEISKFENVGFDLTGRMVSVKDNVRGVNIVNGKKLIK